MYLKGTLFRPRITYLKLNNVRYQSTPLTSSVNETEFLLVDHIQDSQLEILLRESRVRFPL